MTNNETRHKCEGCGAPATCRVEGRDYTTDHTGNYHHACKRCATWVGWEREC